MSVTHYTRYTCDRCGATEERTGSSDCPLVTVELPPHTMYDGMIKAQICRECLARLIEFFATVEAENTARVDEIA